MVIEEHWKDAEDNPAGGVSHGIGFTISWQNGPLGRGENRRPPNGASIEDVLRSVRSRIEFFQDSEFACKENSRAADLIADAIEELCQRTTEREARSVEGTHAV